MEYRGIKLNESVKLYKKDGSFNPQVKSGIDRLVDAINENNHSIMSDYAGNKAEMLIDFKCGHNPHWISASNYKQGRGCPKCSGHSAEQAKSDLTNLIKKNNHELLSEYTKEKEAVLIDFKCGHDPHWISPDKYKQGKGCRLCGEIKRSKSKNENAKIKFSLTVKERGHELLSPYIDVFTKVLIDFKCGHDYHLISPNDYKNSNRGCPTCSTSKGVKIICEEFLDINDISYEIEYKLPIHSHKRNGYRYDIFVPRDNLIIEVHGGQHYFENHYYHSKGRTLNEEQRNDRAKRELAESMGYKYIEVDYKESNPELALKRFIEQYSLIRNEVAS